MVKEYVKQWVVKMMEDALANIKADNCNMSEAEIEAVFDALANVKMNKYQSAQFVQLSTSQFDNEVKVGRIPEGKKLYAGDSKLYWTKSDLINYLKVWRKKA